MSDALLQAAATALLDQVEAAEEESRAILRSWRRWTPWGIWRVMVLARWSNRILDRYDELFDDD